MTDALMMRIEMRRGGTARGVVGASMAPTVDVARILLRLAFPSFSRVQWTKTAEGFAFEALMPAAWLNASVDDGRRVLDDPASAMVPPPAAPAPAARPARKPSSRAGRRKHP